MGEAGGEGEHKGAVEYCKGDDRQGGEGMGGVGGDLAWWANEVGGCMFGMYSGLGIEQAMLGKWQTHRSYRTAYLGSLIYKLLVCRRVINSSISWKSSSHASSLW
jgi:hypothetical protein